MITEITEVSKKKAKKDYHVSIIVNAAAQEAVKSINNISGW